MKNKNKRRKQCRESNDIACEKYKINVDRCKTEIIKRWINNTKSFEKRREKTQKITQGDILNCEIVKKN